MKISRRTFVAAAMMAAAPALAFAGEAGWNPETPYDTDIVIGSAKAPVTVVEYASMTCPHCGRFHNESWPEFKERWIDTGKAKLVFRHLPLDQSALAAALTVSCVPAEGRARLLSAFFSSVSEWAPKQDIAPVVSKTFDGTVKMEDVMACLSREGFATKVMQPGTDAVNNGVDSTPTFFVAGKTLVGFQSAETLGKAVDDAIAQKVLD